MIIILFLIDFIFNNFIGMKSIFILVDLYNNKLFYVLLTTVFIGFLWNDYLLSIVFILSSYIFNRLLFRLNFKNKTVVISCTNYFIFLIVILLKNGFAIMADYLYLLPLFLLLSYYVHKLKKNLI